MGYGMGLDSGGLLGLSMGSVKKIGIGMIGCGVVGGGVVRHLKENYKLIASRSGLDVEIRKVAVQDLLKDRGVAKELLTTDWREVISDPTVDVVELTGGVDLPEEIALASIEAGKPLVTANKAMLAERADSIFPAAHRKGIPIYFEAAVAGGIPILKLLCEGLRANRILQIHGIINGTCNYILTRMEAEKLPFETILAEAKELGYAEADESLDVDGVDAAHKAALLAGLAYGAPVPFDRVYVEGIREVTPVDMEFASRLGYTIKLLATIIPHDGGELEVRVNPTLVPKDHILAGVTDVFNAVQVVGDVVGSTFCSGMGAGASPTASAVLADIIDAGMGAGGLTHIMGETPARILPMGEARLSFLARLTVKNHPGVLAQVAQVFGNNGIGISSVFQPEDVQAAITEIKKLDVVAGPCPVIRLEEFE